MGADKRQLDDYHYEQYWLSKLFTAEYEQPLASPMLESLCQRLAIDHIAIYSHNEVDWPVNRLLLASHPQASTDAPPVQWHQDKLQALLAGLQQGETLACESDVTLADYHCAALLALPIGKQPSILHWAMLVSAGERPWTEPERELSQRLLCLINKILPLDAQLAGQQKQWLQGYVIEQGDLGYFLLDAADRVTAFKGNIAAGDIELPESLAQFIDQLHPDDQAAVEKSFQDCRRETGSYYESCRILLNNEWCWLQLHINTVNAESSGEHGDIIAVFTDVTQYMEQQFLLKDSWDRAEAANIAKSDFLARMSHEIRTPMNAVIGMAHLLAGTELTPRQEDYLAGISGSATDLLRIINDILDFSKIEADKLEIEQHDFNLDDLIDNMAAIFNVNLKDNPVEIIYDIEDELPRNLNGDGERLRQVLINLISNALKFTHRGHVILEARQLRGDKETLFVQFRVVDTGIGMSEEQLQQLFKPFEQADGSTSRKFGGTGLGLSISKRLVELMGGEISVDSAQSAGTSFTFYLPFGYGVLDRPVSEVAKDKIENMHALIVDDDEVSREVLARTVSSFGMQTTVAIDGKEAVNKVFATKNQPHHYDVIFMDYRMPELDGVTAAKLIKTDKELAYAPTVVMVSGVEYQLVDDVDSGAVDMFLTKPVSRSRIFDTLAELFGKGEVEVKKSLSGVQPCYKKLQGVKVLLVEDNVVNQKVAEGILKKQGVQVTIANHGVEALELLANLSREAVDMIFMDMEMPEMNGFDTTRAIRAEQKWADVPIIAMTAHAIKGDRERCLSAGMDGYVSKPISPQFLYQTILEVLQ